MTVAHQLEDQSVVPMESSIPLGMTCDAWRRWRSPRLGRPRLPGARLLAAALRILAPGARPCHHIHESTTHYDHDQKLLSFLLVCRVCGTEKLVHSQPYEPRFEPHPARHYRGTATVDHLHGRPRTGARRAVLHGTPCTEPTGDPQALLLAGAAAGAGPAAPNTKVQ